MTKLTPEQQVKRKRINSIILSVFFICAACMVGIYILAHDDTGSDKTTRPAQAVTIPGWDMTKLKPLPYAAVKADKDYRATINRTKLHMRIVLVEKTPEGKITPLTHHEHISKEQLAATVIAAAKYYAQKTGAHYVGVALDPQFPSGWDTPLATADYAPDGKGVSGSDNWTWKTISVMAHGKTARELEIQRLWGEMRGQYQTPQGTTDEDALTKAIAKKLGITEKETDVPVMMPEIVPEDVAELVEILAGLK